MLKTSEVTSTFSNDGSKSSTVVTRDGDGNLLSESVVSTTFKDEGWVMSQTVTNADGSSKTLSLSAGPAGQIVTFRVEML